MNICTFRGGWRCITHFLLKLEGHQCHAFCKEPKTTEAQCFCLHIITFCTLTWSISSFSPCISAISFPCWTPGWCRWNDGQLFWPSGFCVSGLATQLQRVWCADSTYFQSEIFVHRFSLRVNAFEGFCELWTWRICVEFFSRQWSHPSMSTEVFGNYQFHMLRFFECIFLPGFVETNVGTLEKSHHLVDHHAVFDLYQYLSDPCVVMIFYAYIYYKSDFKYRQICKSDGSYEIWSSAKRNDANQKSQQFPFRLHVFVHPAIWSWIKQHHEADVCRGQIPWEF